MNISLQIALVLIGLLHTPPALSGLSAKKLAALYRIDTNDQVLLVLLHHRAILFAVLAAACYYSAFSQQHAIEVSVAAFVAMLSFIGIAFTIKHNSPAIKKITIADVIGVAVLTTGWLLN